MEKVEFISFRFFGGVTPLAVLSIGGRQKFFTLEGVKSLMAMYRDDENYVVLVNIERDMLAPEFNVGLSDLNEKDLSGQGTLF